MWPQVNDWFTELGFRDYNLSDACKILGDLENEPIANTLILFTKKVIYDSFKLDKLPTIYHIENEVTNHCYLEKYFHYIRGKTNTLRKGGTD